MLKLLVVDGNIRLRLPVIAGSTEDKFSQGRAIIFFIFVYLHGFLRYNHFKTKEALPPPNYPRPGIV